MCDRCVPPTVAPHGRQADRIEAHLAASVKCSSNVSICFSVAPSLEGATLSTYTVSCAGVISCLLRSRWVDSGQCAAPHRKVLRPSKALQIGFDAPRHGTLGTSIPTPTSAPRTPRTNTTASPDAASVVHPVARTTQSRPTTYATAITSPVVAPIIRLKPHRFRPLRARNAPVSPPTRAKERFPRSYSRWRS
jgi:hypothetical protein